MYAIRSYYVPLCPTNLGFINITVWRPNQLRTIADDILNHLLGPQYFGLEFLHGVLLELIVSIGMVADDVAIKVNLPHEIRMFLGPAANDEKCSFDTFTLQDFQHLWRESGVWHIVERKGDLLHPGTTEYKSLGILTLLV